MPLSHNPNTFNVTPYYDDYSEDNNYLRTLFRPGRSVQARELTQIQTTLQNQIEKFGSHIFDNGAVIAGGEISESTINFVRLDTNNTLSTSDLNSLVGQKINSGNIHAQVYHVLGGSTLSDDSNQVVFYQYTTQGLFTAGSEIGTTGSEHVGVTFGIMAGGTTADAIGSDSTIFTISDGVFFVDGFFVKSGAQTIVPFNNSTDGTYRSFGSPTSAIGYGITRNIKTSDDDATLRDPASGFYNHNAPGADRYNIDLSIKQIPFSSSLGDATGLTFDNSDFIELVRMVGGTTTKTVRYTNYSDIEETLARRTFDESGNYTVNTPGIRILDHGDVFSPSDPTKFAVAVDPNKSYVGGYEIDTQSPVFLEVDKPRDTSISRNEYLDVDFGDYVLINTTGSTFGKGIVGADDETGSFRALTDQTGYNILNSSNAVIGTTNVRTIKKSLDGSETRVYVFNTKITDPYASHWGHARYLMIPGDTYNILTLQADSNGFIGPFNAGKRSLLFPTTGTNTITDKGFQDIALNLHSRFVCQKQDSINIPAGTSSGFIEINEPDILGLTDDEQYLVVLGITADSPAKLLNDSEYNINVDNPNNKLTLNLNNMVAPVGGASASVIYPVIYGSAEALVSQGIVSNRVLTTTSVASESTSRDSSVFTNGITYGVFELDKSHVKSIDTIYNANDSSLIDTSNILLDDGQRQSAFLRSRIYVPLTSLADIDGDINVAYDYYAHSGNGPVTVSSYDESYTDIPSFTDPDSGVRYNLRNYVDFRPVESSTGFVEFGIPYHNLTVPSVVDFQFYMPRIDKVCLCKDRTYRVVKGTSSTIPEAPQTTAEDMDLYHVVMSPYTFDKDKDIKVRYIDNKRFTMRQIGEIEDNFERLESERYIESLHNDTIARASGEALTAVEDAVLVDDFSGHAYADVTVRDHNCSMDSARKGLRPPYTTDSVIMLPSTPTGLSKSSDGVYTYKFSSIDVYNTKDPEGDVIGTGTIQVNPFGSTDYLGSVKLTPYSDTWYDTSVNPSVLVNTFGENNAWESNITAYQSGRVKGFGSEYKEWINHWCGSELINNDTTDNDPENRQYKNPTKSATSRLPGRIIETINDKTVDKSVVPYMRSLGVTFEADGLLPDSTVYAIFDNTLVGATSSGYQVDNNGSVTGNITIPASTFLTGEKLFRLTDSKTDTLASTNTAADATFYAKGLIGNRDKTVSSVRPPIIRRKSTKSDSIINDYYEQNLNGNYSDVINGLEPLTQEFIVDAGVYPQGMFISSIDLFFKKVDSALPVTMQIRPMVNSTPHTSLVVPFSETTVVPSMAASGPSDSTKTAFTFSTPVYLAPGSYGICLVSNSPNNTLFKAVAGDTPLDTTGATDTGKEPFQLSMGGNGIKLGSLYLPLNNGNRSERTDEVLTVGINRCQFDASTTSNNDRLLQFSASPSSGITAQGQIVTMTCNDQIFTSDTVKPTFNLVTSGGSVRYDNIIPNKDVWLDGIISVASSDDLKLEVQFSANSNNKISPVIDQDRVSSILAYRRSTSIDTTVSGEEQIDSSAATTISRYISKIVSLENMPSTDIRVYLKVKPNAGDVQVYIKTDSAFENFDDNSWKQLYKDGNSSDDDPLNDSMENVTFKPDTNITDIGTFSRYAIKIVLRIGGTASEKDVPTVQDLRAIPLR